MLSDTGLVRDVPGTVADPARAVRELVAPAHGAGAPDNVGCVVADVVTGEAADVPATA
ncbi:hypothetical protein [Streptomyces sp. NPDC017529]|uniref:hypothetical protein n=1 Tax=Streptomyces sp. NPDC017529 TaxID=3365000 RepID=UPI0037932857